MDDQVHRPVDLNVLRSRFAEIGLEESDIAELVDAFLEDTPAGLRQLDQAVAIASSADVASAAHALKSPAATFGAMHLSDLTSDLERRARAGDTANVSAAVAAIRAEFNRVREHLVTEYPDLGS